jgi:hypothetical protein
MREHSMSRIGSSYKTRKEVSYLSLNTFCRVKPEAAGLGELEILTRTGAIRKD